MKSMVEMREIGSGQAGSPILRPKRTGSALKGGLPSRAHSGGRAGIVSTFQQFPVKLALHHAKLLRSEGAREGTNDGRFRYFPVLSGDEFLGRKVLAGRQEKGESRFLHRNSFAMGKIGVVFCTLLQFIALKFSGEVEGHLTKGNFGCKNERR